MLAILNVLAQTVVLDLVLQYSLVRFGQLLKEGLKEGLKESLRDGMLQGFAVGVVYTQVISKVEHLSHLPLALTMREYHYQL